MKFTFRQGLIWIPIEVVYEGQMVRIEDCIIDTGSATTAIDIDMIAFNFRKPAIIRRICGLGGGVQEVVAQAIELIKLAMPLFLMLKSNLVILLPSSASTGLSETIR